LVCSLVHCLSVSIQLAWFLGWGLGRVNGRKEQRFRFQQPAQPIFVLDILVSPNC